MTFHFNLLLNHLHKTHEAQCIIHLKGTHGLINPDEPLLKIEFNPIVF